MSGYLILFFLGGPIVLAVGNLILGPIFNKKLPFRIQFRSFIVGSVVYLLGASLLYFFLLQGKL
ncbi:hypothetical protein ABDK10_07355 [Staphylococcus aureus]